MPDKKVEPLAGLVNGSGFALQLAVEHLVRRSTGLGWRVASVEHPWRHTSSDREGFVDLVLQKAAVTWVVECKRPRDGVWVFLVPDSEPKTVHRFRCLWVAGTSDGSSLAGWDDVGMLPASPESQFCVIRGTGEGDRTLLERLSSTLVLSLDCLADEEIQPFKAKRAQYWGVYLPVIVTAAELHVCRLDPARVSLTDGTIDAASFDEVPAVRFRKAFSPDLPPGASPHSLEALRAAKERTVLVINAAALEGILAQANFVRDEVFEKWPWTVALERIAAPRTEKKSG